jgi:hypothetical protein
MVRHRCCHRSRRRRRRPPLVRPGSKPPPVDFPRLDKTCAVTAKAQSGTASTRDIRWPKSLGSNRRLIGLRVATHPLRLVPPRSTTHAARAFVQLGRKTAKFDLEKPVLQQNPHMASAFPWLPKSFFPISRFSHGSFPYQNLRSINLDNTSIPQVSIATLLNSSIYAWPSSSEKTKKPLPGEFPDDHFPPHRSTKIRTKQAGKSQAAKIAPAKTHPVPPPSWKPKNVAKK